MSKGHYHTVKDALDIVCHRRVTDDISEVSISARPYHTFPQRYLLWNVFFLAVSLFSLALSFSNPIL